MSALAKLMQARITLQGKELKKSGHNKFAGYNYFELGDFLPTVQQIFHDLGLCGVVSYGKEEAWLTITDLEDGSSTAICSPMSTAALKGCHEVQNLGAVQTYIRRYLWVTAMEIVEHDQLDADTGKDSGKKQGKGVISPNGEALNNVNSEELIVATDAAKFIIDSVNDENWEAAYEQYIYMTREYKQEHGEAVPLAMWALLQPHSKIRNKLKAMKAERESN